MMSNFKRMVPWRVQRLFILAYRKVRKTYLIKRNEHRAKMKLLRSRNYTNKDNNMFRRRINLGNFLDKLIKKQTNTNKRRNTLLETKIESTAINLFSKIDFQISSIPLEALQNLNDEQLVFIEHNACMDQYDWIVELLSSGKKHNTFIFKTKKDYLRFLESIDSSNELALLIDQYVHVMPPIDPELDEFVYEKAEVYSQELLEGLIEQLSESESLEEYATTIMSLKVSVSDRLSNWIRVFRYISSYIENHQVSKLIFVGSKSRTSNLLTFAIKASLNIDVIFLNLSDLGKKKYDIWDYIRRASMPLRTLKIKRYPFNRYIHENCVLICGSFIDPMYRDTLQPVINKLAETTDKKLLIVQNSPTNWNFGTDRISILDSVLEVDNLPGAIETLESLDYSISHFVEEGNVISESEALFRLYLTLNTRSSIYRLLRDVYVLKYDIDEFKKNNEISGIVSSPGRMWASLYLVKYLSDVPSIEIQSGIISRTKRYKKLYSDMLLAMDDYSMNIYTDYLGYDLENVIVMGSPRIDKRLEKYRSFSKKQSRKKINIVDNDCKIACITTQPYVIELMGSMVKEVAMFVERHDDWLLIVSMHHNESEEYERVYVNILDELLKQKRAVITRENVYHNMNASDMVITYFSTTGLEAFCLGKPVYSYRPNNNTSVPYDLCELGVAQPFRTFTDLSQSKQKQNYELSEGLKRLRDGQSANRISEYISKAIS